jgi:hypothetical protein
MEKLLVIDVIKVWSGRDLNDDDASGLQDSVELLDGGKIILDMLQHVQANDAVKTPVGQRALHQIEL